MIRKSLSLIATLFIAVLMFGVQVKSHAQSVYGICGDFGSDVTSGIFVCGEGYFIQGQPKSWLQISGNQFDFESNHVVDLSFDASTGTVTETLRGGYSTYDSDGNFLGTKSKVYAFLTISSDNGVITLGISFADDVTGLDQGSFYNSNGLLSQFDGAATVTFQ